MVFLGGAVLANIVSLYIMAGYSALLTVSTDGRQGEYVDIEAGMARTGRESSGEVGAEMIAIYMKTDASPLRAIHKHGLEKTLNGYAIRRTIDVLTVCCQSHGFIRALCLVVLNPRWYVARSESRPCFPFGSCRPNCLTQSTCSIYNRRPQGKVNRASR